MSRPSEKIVKGAHEYLESGEEVLVPLAVRGSMFELEANAASGAPALAEAYERVRAVRA